MLSKTSVTGWQYVPFIDAYVHPDHSTLVAELMFEVTSDDREHGKRGLYNRGCRRQLCKKANRDALRKEDADDQSHQSKTLLEVEPLLVAFLRAHLIHRHEQRLREFDEKYRVAELQLVS